MGSPATLPATTVLLCTGPCMARRRHTTHPDPIWAGNYTAVCETCGHSEYFIVARKPR